MTSIPVPRYAGPGPAAPAWRPPSVGPTSRFPSRAVHCENLAQPVADLIRRTWLLVDLTVLAFGLAMYFLILSPLFDRLAASELRQGVGSPVSASNCCSKTSNG